MTKGKFKPTFLALCVMFKTEPTPELTKLYFDVLSTMTDEEFDSSVKHLMATYKYNTLPKPADILESVKGDPEAQAMFAIEALERAMRDHGAYESVTFQDPILGEIVANHDGGWIGLCACTLDEWTWIKKDFIKMYKARLSSGNYGIEPVALIGKHEDSGNTKVKPVLIGGDTGVKLIANK